MGTMVSQNTTLTIGYSAVYSGAEQRKHQSSASLAFVRGNHRGPVNSPHKWPVTLKMFPFDDVIMILQKPKRESIWRCQEAWGNWHVTYWFDCEIRSSFQISHYVIVQLCAINVMYKINSHYRDVITNAMVSQITSLTIVYSIVHLRADQRKHQSSASLAIVRGIHRWTVNSPHKGPVTWKMFPFDDVIM